MWHHVGLTLLVFVATLLVVLLLMVCGEWGARGQGSCTSATYVADWVALIGL